MGEGRLHSDRGSDNRPDTNAIQHFVSPSRIGHRLDFVALLVGRFAALLELFDLLVNRLELLPQFALLLFVLASFVELDLGFGHGLMRADTNGGPSFSSGYTHIEMIEKIIPAMEHQVCLVKDCESILKHRVTAGYREGMPLDILFCQY